MLRFFYIITFGLAGTIAGAFVALAYLLYTLGAFWLYLFGDKPWPSWAEQVLFGPLPIAVFAITVLSFLWFGLQFAKKKELEIDRAAELHKAKKRLVITAGLWVIIVSTFVIFLRFLEKGMYTTAQT